MADNKKSARFAKEVVIGRGSFGRVYKALDTKLSKNGEEYFVAIKKFEVDGCKIEEAFFISKEATFLATLSHPNILKYVDSFYEENIFYLITEYCNGGSLYERKIKQKEETNENIILKWLGQSTDALNYIHDQNILHCDLKPHNMFLKNDNIKIGDFGISVLLNGTKKAFPLGYSIDYMSPELIIERRNTFKSDIWAYGISFYELCTFETKPYGITNRENYKDLPSKYSKDLNELIKNMVKINTEERFTAENITNFLIEKFNINPTIHKILRITKKLSNELNMNESIENELSDILKIYKELQKKAFSIMKKKIIEIPDELKKFLNEKTTIYKINFKNINKLNFTLGSENKIKIENFFNKTHPNADVLIKIMKEENVPDIFKKTEENEKIIRNLKIRFWDHDDGLLLRGRGLLLRGLFFPYIFGLILSIDNDFAYFPDSGYFVYCNYRDFKDVFIRLDE